MALELLLNDFKMRLVEESDAGFILELRTDKELAKFLHETSEDIELQKKWIREYKKRESQKAEYYFIAETYAGEKLGMNRIYNFDGNIFELGSWIFKKGLAEAIPITADITVRDFAYEQLGFKKCKFDVRKDNKSVVRYHLLFHPARTGEDELNYYFELDYETYKVYKHKILKLFKNG